MCIEKCGKEPVKKECNTVTKRCIIPRLNKTKKVKQLKKYNLIIENDDENLSPKNVVEPVVVEPVVVEPVVAEPVVSELIIREPSIEEPIVINDADKCIERCSKEPIKTKCNTLTKRCIAPIKKLNKSKKTKPKQTYILNIVD